MVPDYQYYLEELNRFAKKTPPAVIAFVHLARIPHELFDLNRNINN